MIGFLKPFVAASCIAVTGASASASACITAEEAAADQVRFIDMQLRVAALTCRGKEPRMVGHYNRFVEAHRPMIIASRAPVERYLGRHANRSIDEYVTEQANRLSLESIGLAGFCQNTLALAVVAARASDATSVLDMMPISYRLPARLCRQSGGIAANVAPSFRSALGNPAKGN